MNEEVDALLKGCLNNDRQSQRQLYEKFAPSLFTVCRRYANNETDAEDILAEGFINVFNSLQSFRGDSSLFQWMKSIIVKTAVSYFRKNGKHYNDVSLEDDYIAQSSSFENELLTKLDARNILKVLEQMPDEWRVIFNLRIMEEFSFKEIAEQLDKNENTVRVYFLRGKQWLIDKLKNEKYYNEKY